MLTARRDNANERYVPNVRTASAVPENELMLGVTL